MVTAFVDVSPGGSKVYYADGPPLVASDLGGVRSAPGDMVIVTAPGTMDAQAPTTWTCVAGGTPGTWISRAPDARASGVVTNAQVLALFTTPVTVIPAQGPGTHIEIVSLWLENAFLTAAFAGGGAISLNYGTGAGTLALTATIPATFLTAPAASQVIQMDGAVASSLASTITNQPVVLAVATANFTTGAGSLIYRVKYRVHTGMV